ncbi:hypothetical protein ACI2UK_24315 [Ralstonia nicotianae]|uniref:hypothetical protein n=1 Tax=Ralstonia pseudosolanacearum TaxID=1310165 RepID=UPI0020032F73|nr:hypothetical protein [Ralstonia pseudosolanacearum]MCK4120432.1 hypothetical protein [Ralstonia pseudosolanacearum]
MTTIVISAAEAECLLPNKNEIHTFIRHMCWMGATVDRVKVLEAFNAAQQVELCGAVGRMKHQLVVSMDGVRTYVETDQQKLAKLFPNLAAF